MDGTIADGDKLELVSAVRPRIGEIWAYLDDSGGIVVHRYVGSRRGGLMFRGDALASTDQLVAPARLVGRVNRTATDGSIGRIRRIGGLRRVGLWKAHAAVRRLTRRDDRRR